MSVAIPLIHRQYSITVIGAFTSSVVNVYTGSSAGVTGAGAGKDRLEFQSLRAL